MAMADSTIRMPEALMAEVQKRADAEERAPEELVQEAVEQYLRRKRREKLYAHGEEQARKLGIREEDIPGIVKEVRQTAPRSR
jgi:predicted transcriptional regulator